MPTQRFAAACTGGRHCPARRVPPRPPSNRGPAAAERRQGGRPRRGRLAPLCSAAACRPACAAIAEATQCSSTWHWQHRQLPRSKANRVAWPCCMLVWHAACLLAWPCRVSALPGMHACMHACSRSWCPPPRLHCHLCRVAQCTRVQERRTPLYLAAGSGHTLVVQLLLRAGADKEAAREVSQFSYNAA